MPAEEIFRTALSKGHRVCCESVSLFWILVQTKHWPSSIMAKDVSVHREKFVRAFVYSGNFYCPLDGIQSVCNQEIENVLLQYEEESVIEGWTL